METEYTDEQLISLYRQGDISSFEKIMERYKGLVRKKTSDMFLIGGDEQDLLQEGMIGLVKAVRDYDFGRDASFMTFADLCISRQIYKAIQASGRFKNLPLNNYVSLTADRTAQDGSDIDNLMSEISGEALQDPQEQIISKENVHEINNLIDKILTETERDVFRLYLTEIPTSQIAAILGVEPKSADNALQRAKTKLKKAIKK